MRPFAFLAELAAHEDQLLAGMAPHEGVVGAQIGKALPAVAGHAPEDRALAVHHLVMRQRQDEVLAEGIEQAEGEPVVMVAPVDGIARHVVERVMHPAHVPFVAEAQAAEMNRMRHARPGSRLLGDRHRTGIGGIELGVHLAQEFYRLDILAPAMDVGDPFARRTGIVEVEHGGDGIDPEAVDVIALQPEQRRGEKEIGHFAPAVIVDQRVPVAVKSLPGVGVLVERGAVEMPQSMRVGREMRRHPVHDHADAGSMAALDEAGEGLGRAVARGRREEPDRLVAP